MSRCSTRPILALDFDGVVCQSVAECLETSYLTYCQLNPGVPSECPALWRSLFRARRGVVRPSGNYSLLWDWITRFPDRDLSAEQFEELGRGQEFRVQEFESRFHSLRDASIWEDPLRFVDLNPLYPGVIEAWSALREWPLYIVSTKDEPAINLILQSHRLVVDGVFGRGSGGKAQTLLSLAGRHRVVPQQVVFIDDNAFHVADASAAGITAVVADWGYGPQDPGSRVSLNTFAEIPLFLSRLEAGR
jgi:phosphoglycolate phosphatase-like HAD superfamily hydrolase